MTANPSVKDLGITEDVPRSRFRDCALCSSMPEQLGKLLSYWSPFKADTPDRLIVAARHKEDTSWLDVYLSDIPHVVYQVGDTAAQYTTTINKGNEATPYLQYIIDNYNNLPKSVVFSHGHKRAWHLEDKVRILRTLRWGELGFANLRHANMVCPEVWNCKWLRLDWRWNGNWLHPRDWDNQTRLQEPADEMHGLPDHEHGDSWLISRYWEDAFAGALGPLPEEVTSPCCSEFLVHRNRILARPREFYIHVRDWIYNSPENSFNCGKFLEHTWAMIFGEPAVHRPIQECKLIDCDVDGGQVRVFGYGDRSY